MGGKSTRRPVPQPPRGARTRPGRRARRRPPVISFPELARRVRAHLGQDHRYAHTVRVARLAGRLAHAHGEGSARARLAGMLHDLARLYPAERLVAECAARGLAVDEFERRNPVVLHARLGAELARERFAVRDEAVLDAIRRHTVAGPAMSPLAIVLYLADGLEPGRRYEERARLEAFAFENLEGAFGAVLRSTVAYLRERGLEAAPQTLAALEDYELLERRPLPA